jgi:hypothetical protein
MRSPIPTFRVRARARDREKGGQRETERDRASKRASKRARERRVTISVYVWVSACVDASESNQEKVCESVCKFQFVTLSFSFFPPSQMVEHSLSPAPIVGSVARQLNKNIDFIVAYYLCRVAALQTPNIDPLVDVFTQPPCQCHGEYASR